LSLICTLVLSLATGAFSGFIASREIFNPAYALFRDDDHFYDMMHKYPKSYLVGTDEHYGDIATTIGKIKNFFKKDMAAHSGDKAYCFKTFAEKVWNEHNTAHDDHLNKAKTKIYLTEMCQKMDKEFEMDGNTFDEIFKMIDTNVTHTVDMDEMVVFLENFTQDKKKEPEKAAA
jgi:hypothetical protein